MTDVTASTATLMWEEPEEDGGYPVISFMIEKRDVKRKMWQTVEESCEDTQFTVRIKTNYLS